MKQECKCAFRDAMSKRLRSARKKANLTQSKFSELLMMDTRSYISLEQGTHCCCALTLILYLVFVCNDVDGFISEMRQIILSVYNRHDAS